MESIPITVGVNVRDINMSTFSSSKGFREPIFSFASSPIKGRVESLTNLTYCRESVCEYLRQELRKLTDRGLDQKRLRILAFRRVNMKNYARNLEICKLQMDTTLAMLNAIEKYYKWPLTKIYPTIIDETRVFGIRPNNGLYYVKAGLRWMKSPVMLSMFLLLFRLATNAKCYRSLSKIKDIDSAFEVLRSTSETGANAELSYFRVHGDRWRVVLDNYHRLFGMRDMRDLYQPSKGGGFYFAEGINKLCDESSNDPLLNRTFSKIVKEYWEKSHDTRTKASMENGA